VFLSILAMHDVRTFSVDFPFKLTLHYIRFWYGNEGGNRNNFDTKEACNEVCVEPEGKKVRNPLQY